MVLSRENPKPHGFAGIGIQRASMATSNSIGDAGIGSHRQVLVVTYQLYLKFRLEIWADGRYRRLEVPSPGK